MEFIETSRIDIRVRYDLISKVTSGEVYSKIEKEGEEILVGYVTDEVAGTGTLHIFKGYKDNEYIKEDFNYLQTQFADIANMWKARVSRGIY